MADFASCLSLGMEPAGFVQGFAVMQWSWYSGYYRTAGGFGGMGGWTVPRGQGQYAEEWRCPHGFVGAEHRTYGFNAEQAWLEKSWAEGWGLAYRRMVEEAAEAGAHGVIGIVDDMHYLTGGQTAEFRISGTAVRGARRRAAPHPVHDAPVRATTDQAAGGGVCPGVGGRHPELGADDRLLHHPLPVGRHRGSVPATGCRAGSPGSTPSPRSTRHSGAARHLAREHIRQQIGTDSLHGATFEQFEHEVGEGDMAIQCLVKGTRVRQFKDFDPLPDADPVVRLT